MLKITMTDEQLESEVYADIKAHPAGRLPCEIHEAINLPLTKENQNQLYRVCGNLLRNHNIRFNKEMKLVICNTELETPPKMDYDFEEDIKFYEDYNK